jgi:pyruvate/2-oxoglutarate dehydrogenase complex dihydrolipoamide acyltransferase (E2) component
MNMYFGWLGAAAMAASAAAAPLRRDAAEAPRTAAPSPCAADSNFQRLAFWVGDWEVVDSIGAHYATQRVRAVLEACAITAEWASGGGYKGMALFAFDVRTAEWRQMYAANQVPSPSGVELRKSDSSYPGPGVRFILLDPTAGEPKRSRVTIMPMSDHRAMQLFEDSSDGGKTWHTVFKAEHRPQKTVEP